MVKAFSECITTYYAARREGRRADGPLLAFRADAGGRLVEELGKRGVRVSEEEAGRFDPPEWFGDEVTGDERYLNETLATRGRPS